VILHEHKNEVYTHEIVMNSVSQSRWKSGEWRQPRTQSWHDM